MKKITFWLIAVAALMIVSPTLASRRVVSLDGQWQIAEGGLSDAVPATFDHTVPVPGLVDLSKPAFADVGVTSPQRQAFWYKRSFMVRGPESQIALLKINKAMFGTTVWLNGSCLGEHLGCFTPGYFDVSKLLKYNAANTLIVRVGACRESLPASIPSGTDNEKTIWTPGIYDSVSLTLTEPPYIGSMQVAPHINDGSITVQVAVKGAAEAPLRFSVRECKSGRVVAKAGVQSSEGIIAKKIRLKKPRLWSPEDPFLYVLKCETDTDAVETRFGMREFHYDVKTGRAILNGKPYYLRGTNFCMFRFFEDPARGSLLWNRQWARKLLTLPKKSLHWNSARVCIAPFPEFYYDMADELGWLLQDEYPIWGFNDNWSQDELKTEFGEWMRERWNHPSIIVWDANNETVAPRTRELIRSVRSMDLSNRPWDNGWGVRDRATDAAETHPYTFLRFNSALSTLPSIGVAQPAIINEYDAFWMGRDGGLGPWFAQWYKDMLGPKATLNQKRELLAYNGAISTEYWRARRQAAGVQWFCYLSYSKPGMVTSDNFADIQNLVIEPHFVDYLSNAFSPLGVMIDDKEIQHLAGSRKDYRVIITNDLDQRQSGVVVLKFTDIGSAREASRQSSKFNIKAFGQSVIHFHVRMPARPGNYRLVAELVPVNGEKVRSRRNIRIISAAQAKRERGIAGDCRVFASSEYPGCSAGFAVDGSKTTRWSSQFSDPQWITLDLGAIKSVGRVSLSWETAYGKSYKIQVSGDNNNWTDVYSTDSGKGGVENIKFPAVSARYVRLYGTARATTYGYSLWEFGIFKE